MDIRVYQRVKAVFDRYGVPEVVWYPIAQMESGFNPNAIGDNGESIGLFQINVVRGQGYGYDPERLKDPEFNAAVAAPAIAAAFHAIRDSVPRARWAAETAIRSGHPGGSVNNPLTNDAGQRAVNRLITLQSQFERGAAAASNVVSGAVNAVSDVVDVKGVADQLNVWIEKLQKTDWRGIGISASLGVIGVLLLLLVFLAILFEHRNAIAGAVATGAKLAA